MSGFWTWFWWGVASIVFVNVILRFRETKADVEVRILPSKFARVNKLVVAIPGFGGDGLIQHYNAKDALTSRGHLLTVHNDGKYGSAANAYSIDMAVRAVYDAVLYYGEHYGIKSVEFYGSSMGARVAVLVKPYLEECGYSCKAVFIDSPPSGKYLQPFQRFALVPFLTALPYLPFLCLLMLPPFERIVALLAFPAPKKKDIEAGLSLEKRAIPAYSVKMSRSAKATYLRDQVGELAREIPSVAKPWGPYDVTFIRSDKDGDVTLPTAREGWQPVLKSYGIHPIILCGVGHCHYGPRPTMYEKGFRRAQAFLDRG